MFTNPKFWWLIGRYIGDGWTTMHKRIDREESYSYKTLICCSKKDKTELQEIVSRVDGLFKYNIIEERTVYKVTICNMELFEYLQQFGKYAHGKKLTNDIFDLPTNLLKEFLDGYLSADGYNPKTNDKFYSFSSVSRELIYGLGQCVAKVYHRPYSVYYGNRSAKGHTIEGRKVNQRPNWCIHFKTVVCKQDQAFYEDGYIWSPIRGYSIEEYDGFVYNMEVETDNSYTVNNIVVHNCTNISQANSKGVTGLKGEASSLFFDYLRILNYKLPKWFIFENVKNLLHSNNGEDMEIVKTTLGENYNIVYKVVNTADYGVPQTRNRIYVIGQRKDFGEFNYTYPMTFPLTVKVKDLLEKEVASKYYLTDKMKRYVLDQGAKSYGFSIKTDLDIACTLVSTMHKMHRAGIDNYYHMSNAPEGRTNLRRLTPRECARLQGLPDTYKIVVSDTQAYRQFGNAMSLNVVETIVTELKKFIDMYTNKIEKE